MSDYLNIRLLNSSLLQDFEKELGDDIPTEKISSLINPDCTFKFIDLPEKTYCLFTTLAGENHLPFWKSPQDNGNNLVISFPNWHGFKQFFTAIETKLPGIAQETNRLKENFDLDNWSYSIPNGNFDIKHPLIMGILNVTPDSFSDGGRYLNPDKAYQRAMEMIESGADIIDIGAESTRPGAESVGLEEEWNRLSPVLTNLRKNTNIPISIDTYKSEIAKRAISVGVDVINDISGLTFDAEMAKIAADAEVPVIMMHIKGTPKNMQRDPIYKNLMEEIHLYFKQRIHFAQNYGIRKIIIDPGIGFGKRLEDNFELIRRLKEFKVFGYPLLVGPSRKSFIGKALNKPTEDRLFGTASAVTTAILNGASIVRVHDVEEMAQIVDVTQAIRQFKAE